MSDLFDDAKAARDTTLAEYERLFAGDDELEDHVKDGSRLGCHMAAVLMTFVMQKLQGASGEIESAGLQQMLAVAIAEPIAYVCAAFRPVRNGRPLTQMETLHQFGAMLGRMAEHKISLAENGLQDFVVPFEYRNGKVVEKEAFDVMALLNKGQGA